MCPRDPQPLPPRCQDSRLSATLSKLLHEYWDLQSSLCTASLYPLTHLASPWAMFLNNEFFRKNWKWFAHGIRTGDRGWGWLVIEDSWGEGSSLDSGICGRHSQGKEGGCSLTLPVILLGEEGVWDNSLTCKAWGEKDGEKQIPGARTIPHLQV